MGHGASPPDENGFRQIFIASGLSTGPEILPLVEVFFANIPGNEASENLELKLTRVKTGHDVYVRRTGYADDSVDGEEYVGGIIQHSHGDWELFSLAARDLCDRGRSDSGNCFRAWIDFKASRFGKYEAEAGRRKNLPDEGHAPKPLKSIAGQLRARDLGINWPLPHAKPARSSQSRNTALLFGTAQRAATRLAAPLTHVKLRRALSLTEIPDDKSTSSY